MKSMLKHFIVLFLVCLLLFSLGACAQRTEPNIPSETVSKIHQIGFGSVAALSIEELCTKCPVIVRGRVSEIGDAYNFQVGDSNPVVRTGFTIEVNEVFKGDVAPGEEITSWILGGETDTIIMTTEEEVPDIDSEWFFFIFNDGSYYSCGEIQSNGTVAIPEFFVPEYYAANDHASALNVSANNVAELIRGYLGQTSTAG